MGLCLIDVFFRVDLLFITAFFLRDVCLLCQVELVLVKRVRVGEWCR